MAGDRVSTPGVVALAVVSAIGGYEAGYPTQDAALIRSWAQVVEAHRVPMGVALASVERWYTQQPGRGRMLPRDLAMYVRWVRQGKPDDDAARPGGGRARPDSPGVLALRTQGMTVECRDCRQPVGHPCVNGYDGRELRLAVHPSRTRDAEAALAQKVNGERRITDVELP